MRATPIAVCTLAVLTLDSAAWAGTAISADAAPAAGTVTATAAATPAQADAWEKPETIAPLARPERAEPVPGTPEVSRVLRSATTPVHLTAKTSPLPSPTAGDRPTVAATAAIGSSPIPVTSPTDKPQPPMTLASPASAAPTTASQSPPAAASPAAAPVAIAPPETQPQPERSPTGAAAQLVNPDGSFVVADGPVPPPPAADIEDLQNQLRDIEELADFGDTLEGSPAITIAIPSGYGADEGIGFVSTGLQTSVRGSDEADATATLGIGLGDAEEAIGAEISYTIASFGTNRDFGTGGFNLKLHRRITNRLSIAAGWDGFITLGDDTDFEDSVYGAVTYVGDLRPDINDAFSRVALTAGIGNGRFRTEDAILDDDDTIGVFGSAAVRIARPVSAIVEWTGQDLAAGLSIAPFRDFPLVITPALRDLAGAGDEARFVLGATVSFRF